MPSSERQQPNGNNERTPLISNAANSLGNLGSGNGGKSLAEDDRWYVRMPSNFVRLTWLTLASNYVNILLVFVPAGIVLGALDANPTAIFVVNFLAIVPLAALLSFATEELSVKLGQTIGGLMNATFGNAVELIVSIAWAEHSSSSADYFPRSRLLPSPKEKSASFKQACLAQSCPISCSFLDAASLLPESVASKAPSTRLWHRPCLR